MKDISPTESDCDVPFRGVRLVFSIRSTSHLPRAFIFLSLVRLRVDKGRFEAWTSDLDRLLKLPILAFRSPDINIGSLSKWVNISSKRFTSVFCSEFGGRYTITNHMALSKTLTLNCTQY